jgi:TonB family protein
MTSDRFQGGLNLLGQASTPAVAASLPGHLEPRLEVAWGAFHQGVGSSVRALFSRAGTSSGDLYNGFFKDSWVERRVPRRALVAAALWHVAFIVLPPFPGLSLTPHRNPAFDNYQLTWSGPIEDLPLVEIPRQKARMARHSTPNTALPQPGADAFHPRQRIFTDPVRPTHLRQTLIHPAAPFEPPKMLPDLPNIVQYQQAAPARPRLLISEEMLKKLRPRERRVKMVTSAPPLDAPNMEQHVTADMSLPATQNGPTRPKLEINAGAAPRVAQRAQAGDAGPAPEVGATQTSAGGSSSTLIALSATPGPPAPVQPPQGNLAARVSISPEGPKSGGSGSAGGAGSSSVGVSVSGGNPTAKSGVSGLSGGAPKINSPSVRALITRPQPQMSDEEPERTGPPNFSTLPPGAKPEQIFTTKRVYTMNVNMPNLNSSTGSWILNFAELHTNPDAPRTSSSDLSGPVPVKKVDPKYPPSLISERVEGEVVLYAVIRPDGSVDSIQVVHGIDEQLDANAMGALAQWKFRPAAKQGIPVELEAIVHIPFRVPAPQ